MEKDASAKSLRVIRLHYQCDRQSIQCSVKSCEHLSSPFFIGCIVMQGETFCTLYLATKRRLHSMLLVAADLKCWHTGATAVKSSADRKLRTLNISSDGKTCKEPCRLPGSNAPLAAGIALWLSSTAALLPTLVLLFAWTSSIGLSRPTCSHA